jgi:hypothetical protein
VSASAVGAGGAHGAEAENGGALDSRARAKSTRARGDGARAVAPLPYCAVERSQAFTSDETAAVDHVSPVVRDLAHTWARLLLAEHARRHADEGPATVVTPPGHDGDALNPLMRQAQSRSRRIRRGPA